MASQDSAGKKDGSRRRRPRGPNHGGRAARARREARRAARALVCGLQVYIYVFTH